MSTERIQALVDMSGKTVTIQRFSGMPPSVSLTATCKASIRGYSPAELIEPIMQSDREVRVAPKELDKVGIVPHEGDRVIIDGKAMRVENARPEYWFGNVGFYVLRCRG